MEISSSSSPPEFESLEGLEKDDDEDEEEIFDSSGEEQKRNHHQLGEFLVKVVKKISKNLNNFFLRIGKTHLHSLHNHHLLLRLLLP